MVTVTLTGRATRDTEVMGGTLKVAKNGIAVRRTNPKPGEKEADFYNVVAFGLKADILENYINKGDFYLVSGSQKIEEYNGRVYVEVTADKVELLCPKSKSQSDEKTEENLTL